MGPQKHKNEQTSVGHFCGKRAMGAKKNENGLEKMVGRVFFVATYRNGLWEQKKTKMV